MCTHMTSTNISLKKEAYEFLRALKGGGKSFSDVVMELKEGKNDRKMNGKALVEFSKKIRKMDIDWEEREKSMREFREEFEERMERTAKYMEESRK